MISLHALSKHYETSHGTITALNHIQLKVAPGEIMGIIGKSGAGKSSLIRCINLLERPSGGEVIIDGKALMNLSALELREARRKMGMIFQHFNLLSNRTVYDNVSLPLELLHWPHKKIRETVMPLLELTGLSDRQRYYPNQLSGGQKQRVAIARALACKPTVLLSDEATSSLDPQTTQLILQLLKNIRDELNLTIVLITHEMDVIKSCCDRVAVLHQGEIIEENEVGAFFAHPKTALSREFVVSTLQHDLPQMIKQHMLVHELPGTHPVMRVWFFGSATTEPIMAQLISQFGLKINILQGNVEYIKQHAVGVMVIAMDGDKNQLQSSRQYLEKLGVQVEVLGYVPNDIISFA